MELPHDMLIEIAKRRWWAWGSMRRCNRILCRDLTKMDPYAMFTRRTCDIDNHYNTTSWTTDDGVVIRDIKVLTYGAIEVKLRGRMHLLFVRRIPSADRYYNIGHIDEIIFVVKSYDAVGNISTRIVSLEEWYALRAPYSELVKKMN